MATLPQIASNHQATVIKRSEGATEKALSLWQQMDPADLDTSWMFVGPEIVAAGSAVQYTNAVESNTYINRVSSAYGTGRMPNTVVPGAFLSVDGSGRSLDGLLHGAVTTTKQRIATGLPLRDAMLTGATYLAAMMKTALADTYRASDLTGTAAKSWTAYIRVVQAGACSRCAILAGKRDNKTAFLRHPGCRCTTMPIDSRTNNGKIPPGFHDTPSAYFDSLSRAEQDRIFTKGGAEAIRAGADPMQVVSARRGATGITSGGSRITRPGSGRRMQREVIGHGPNGPIWGYTTNEATTVRGLYAQQQRRVGATAARQGNDRYSSVARARLMPETIVGLTTDTELRKVLLRDAGYLERPMSEYYKNASGPNGWLAERTRLQAEDNRIADAFYRSLGIRLS